MNVQIKRDGDVVLEFSTDDIRAVELSENEEMSFIAECAWYGIENGELSGQIDDYFYEVKK